MSYLPPSISAVNFSWEGEPTYTPPLDATSVDFGWYLTVDAVRMEGTTAVLFSTTATITYRELGLGEYTLLPPTHADATWVRLGQHTYPQPNEVDATWVSILIDPDAPSQEFGGVGQVPIFTGGEIWTNWIEAQGQFGLGGQATLITTPIRAQGSLGVSSQVRLAHVFYLEGHTSFGISGKGTVINTWYVPKPMGWLYRVPFNDPPEKSIKLTAPHVDPDRKDPKYRIPWKDCYWVDENKTHMWNEHVVLDNFLTTSAGQFGDLLNRSYAPLWTTPTVIDQYQYYPWKLMNFHFLGQYLKYSMPDTKDMMPVFSWDEFNEYAQSIVARANQAPVKDLWWHIVWGPASYEGKYWNCVPTWGLALAFDLTRVSRVFPEEERDTSLDVREYLYDTMTEATYVVFFDEEERVQASGDFVKQLEVPKIQEGDTSSVWISPTGSLYVNKGVIEGQDIIEGGYVSGGADDFVPFDLSPLGFDLTRIVNTQCEWVPPYDTGPKDNYWELPDILPTFPPPEGAGRSLYLMNSASLVLASDSTNIGVVAMSIDTDIDSWSYTFRATLGNKAALELCMPTTGPVEVIATINGNSFNMLIEGYSERGAFGKTSYSVVGRSIAAELAAPYAEPATLIRDSALNLSQLFDVQTDRVLPTVWTAVWNAQDGLIPANTFEYQEKTPMECMVTLAKSVGAFVYHDPTSRTIYTKPVYKKNPWDFTNGDEDISLDHSYVVSTGHDWKQTPVKNGVYVSGTTADGFLGKVQRLGSAGDLLVPMVTDPLIVTNAIGRERGRYELNKTGKKGDYSLELPISADVEIFLPGKVARIYTDTEDWYGVVMGVSIQAQRSSGGPTIVRQQVKLERHYE